MTGFYKVAQDGGVYITATFYNPDTKEEKTMCVRDYDYADGSRDNDELYYMPINETAKKAWLHNRGIIQVGDTIEVVKGRKVKVGTIAKVVDLRPYKDAYGRTVADYVYLDTGERTNITNCKLCNI